MSINSKLLSLITPEVHGVLWLTKESLTEVTELHETLDYLVDGKVFQFLNKMTIKNPEFEDNQFNYFISKSFDRPFFLIHKKGHVSPKKDFSQIKNLLASNSKEDELSILVISHESFSHIKDFKDLGINVQIYS